MTMQTEVKQRTSGPWLVKPLGAVHRGLWDTSRQKLPCPPLISSHQRESKELHKIADKLNAHAELVAALRELTNTAAWHINVKTGTPDLDGSKLEAAWQKARAALAKVRS